MKVETVVLSRSLRLKKKEREEGKRGSVSACRRSGGCRIERGEAKKLKKLEGRSGRTARGRVLYSLGRAVVITDGRIGILYPKQ